MNRGFLLAGRYAIDEELGQGGFGVVYRARDRVADEWVAIKEYFPSGLCHRSSDGLTVSPVTGERGGLYRRGLERFLEEARTLKRLSHPNIVALRDYLEFNGTAYLVMPFLVDAELDPGANPEVRPWTLKSYLAEHGRLTPAQLQVLVEPLIGALEHVHAHGLLHRDVSPDNILIVDDRPVLIDFGAARYAAGSKTLSAVVKDGYSPPEQYEEEGEESRQGPYTDIYALSATLYQAITGKRPAAATRRLLRDPLQPLSGQYPEFDADLLAMVDAGLVLDPQQRPQTVAEWKKKQELPIDRPSSAVHWRAVVLALLLVALGALGVKYLPPYRERAPEVPSERSVPETIETPEVRSAPTARPQPRVVVGALTVRSEPPGATVTLNGQSTGQQTPAHFGELAEGKYDVSLVLQGYKRWSRSGVEIRGNASELVVATLESATHQLWIETEPEGAAIVLADIPPRYTPGMRLAPGTYTIKITKSGYQDFNAPLKIEADTSVRVRLCRMIKKQDMIEERYQDTCVVPQRVRSELMRVEATARSGWSVESACEKANEKLESVADQKCKSMGGTHAPVDYDDHCLCEDVGGLANVECEAADYVFCRITQPQSSEPCTRTRSIPHETIVPDPSCPKPTFELLERGNQ